MLIIKEGVGIALAKIGLQATNGYVHVCHLPSGGIRLKLVADVFQKYQSEHNSFILIGIQNTTQFICCTPYRIFKTYGSSIIFLLCHI